MPAKSEIVETQTKPAPSIVIDDDGEEYVLHGFGWGKDFPLDIDPRIDLTKPIWEQAQRLAAQDKRGHSKRPAA
jgi:hypothetical protein